jgi:hypothetical protein
VTEEKLRGRADCFVLGFAVEATLLAKEKELASCLSFFGAAPVVAAFVEHRDIRIDFWGESESQFEGCGSEVGVL